METQSDLQTQYQAYRPYSPPKQTQNDFRPFSRQRTSYSGMNQWRNGEKGMRVPETISGTRIPLTTSDANWRKTKSTIKRDAGWPITGGDVLNSAREAHPGLQYDKAYYDLMQKVAYRYPNPGPPRERAGRIGGTWRHIKEVQSNGENRVVFVDGLVRVYDTQKVNSHLLHSGIAPTAKMATPIYTDRRDINFREGLENEIHRGGYKPWYTEKVPRVQDTGLRSMGRMENYQDKYKGFYKMNPTPTNIRSKIAIQGF
ncbi:unnamed protein product [Owenia fusiformis]|uniref:Uncharacterized protein n=1 Tax=Owenia fusiformis TaxID=6347 RepID=A0A8J1U1H9_OWEFU|nr:unnamed protein product [Owenia fusiformis]